MEVAVRVQPGEDGGLCGARKALGRETSYRENVHRIVLLIQKRNEGLELMLSIRSDSTVKCLSLYLFAFACVISPALTAQHQATSSKSWSGVIVSSSCNADEASAESPEHTKSVPDAKLSLYDETSRVMYCRQRQAVATALLGNTVTVRGMLEAGNDSDNFDRANVHWTRSGHLISSLELNTVVWARPSDSVTNFCRQFTVR